MHETFDTYTKRTAGYKILNVSIVCFMVFIFTAIIFPDSISELPNQPLVVSLFLIGALITIGSMFFLPSIKTYKTKGHLEITESTISIHNNIYLLAELEKVEITAGDFRGRATRGGLSDGSGNTIVITAKERDIIELKFVVNSKNQKEKLTEIMKCWKSNGFKIISNGIDLI